MGDDMEPTEKGPRRIFTSRLVLGLFLMFFGTVITLDNYGVIRQGDYLRYWPAFVVLVGAAKLLEPSASRVGAWIWILVGSLLLAGKLGLGDLNRLFPLAFVLFGAGLAWRALSGPRRPAGDSGEDQWLSATAILSGGRRSSRSPRFQGGDFVAVMGGCEVDLREADIEGDEARIDAFAFWGGVEIKVPPGWQVVSRGTAFLGGFDDKTAGPGGSPKRLVVGGLAIMGGVEVKN